MKLLTDVLCTSSICLGSNKLVSRIVSFLIYVQSELKPTNLIFFPPQSGEERIRAERRGEERSGVEKIGAEKSGEKRSGEDPRGMERSGEGGKEKRGAERSGLERRGAKRRREETGESERG